MKKERKKDFCTFSLTSTQSVLYVNSFRNALGKVYKLYPEYSHENLNIKYILTSALLTLYGKRLYWISCALLFL